MSNGLMPLRFSGRLVICFLITGLICGGSGAMAAGGNDLFKAEDAVHVVSLTGFTRARATMEVISEVAGRCLSVAADVGQTIGPDGVFARLDDVFVRLDMDSNQVEQKRLRSRVAYLDKEVERRVVLVRRKSEPQSKLDALEQDLDQARQQLKALQVQAKVLAERRARFTIKAPVGWIVTERALEPGEWVGEGALLARLGDYGTLVVPLALTPDEYRALLNLPRPMTLSVPAEDKKVRASIYRVSPAFDPKTRKLNLELAIKNGLSQMRGGIRLELKLPMRDPSGAILVPPGALTERYQEHWLTKKDGSQVKVVRLGPGPKGMVRVGGLGVRAGMMFRAKGK